jgi:hypothetical protein
MKKPFGCLSVSGLIAALLTILVVVVVGFLFGGKLFNPGPLNAKAGAPLGGVSSHAALSSQCSACHTAFWQTTTNMADKCVACHTDVASQLQSPATLHGDLMKNNPGVTCRDCHHDHLGANAASTDLSKANVNHAAFGYALSAHQLQSDGTPFLCSTCHGTNYTKFDQTTCTTCHQQIKPDFMQPHLQAYGNNCLACHDGVDSYGHNFSHNNVIFHLTGKHAPLACGACHTGARTIADLKATSQTCEACHAKNDAHNGQLGNDCGACHATSGWQPATFDHNLASFKLTGAHASVACTSCHFNNVFKGTPTDCYSCHAKNDAHKGQFGTDCSACHITIAWLPATFDHAKSPFPLTGAHAGLPCTSCHVNNVFKPLSTACAACHANPPFHAGLFTGLACSECHNTGAWSPAIFNLSHPGGCDGNCEHHGGASCRDCHTVNLMTATCTKCHGNNNPGGGG